jgi:hypothetical protein
MYRSYAQFQVSEEYCLLAPDAMWSYINLPTLRRISLCPLEFFHPGDEGSTFLRMWVNIYQATCRHIPEGRYMSAANKLVRLQRIWDVFWRQNIYLQCVYTYVQQNTKYMCCNSIYLSVQFMGVFENRVPRRIFGPKGVKWQDAREDRIIGSFITFTFRQIKLE